MDAKIVIDLGFGDAGKGLTTDYLCSVSKNPIVIRFSGGQQAGHTVMVDGKKHVHSSYGSGALRGVPSYFSEHTSIYLPNILRERSELLKKRVRPELFIHPLAKVTTPFDVAYNRALEEIVGHGSVGIGIAATMKRHTETGYKLHAVDLLCRDVFKAKLFQINLYYLGLAKQSPHPNFMEMYNHHLDGLSVDSAIYLANPLELPFEVVDYDRLSYYDTLIFEGSQGVMLDMDHGIFPNVTWGNTTSKNALGILKNFFISDTEIFYVTRCYQTRHGNGWMSNNQPVKLVNNEEEINVPNSWQGAMKTGELDYDLLNYAMDVDNLYSSEFRKNLVITCLDQRPEFKFDHNKVKSRIFCYYENSSPKHGGMVKTC